MVELTITIQIEYPLEKYGTPDFNTLEDVARTAVEEAIRGQNTVEADYQVIEGD